MLGQGGAGDEEWGGGGIGCVGCVAVCRWRCCLMLWGSSFKQDGEGCNGRRHRSRVARVGGGGPRGCFQKLGVPHCYLLLLLLVVTHALAADSAFSKMCAVLCCAVLCCVVLSSWMSVRVVLMLLRVCMPLASSAALTVWRCGGRLHGWRSSRAAQAGHEHCWNR